MKITKFMRFLLIAIAAVMVFSLFACGETPEEPENTTEEIVDPVESSDNKPQDSEEVEPPVNTESSENQGGEGTEPESQETVTTETDEVVTTETESDEVVTTETESEETTETTETETEAKPECQHTELTEVEAKAATCTEAGNEAYKTCVCGKFILADGTVADTAPVIPALGHDWDEGNVTTAPTCTEKGVKSFTCKNDATHTKTEDIPANGHGEGVKDVTDGCNVKCPVCNVVLKANQHAADKVAANWAHIVAPMDDNGKLYEGKVCSDCGEYAETREIFYVNCFEGIYVNSNVLANPSKGTTQGLGTKEAVAHTYDATTLADENGNALLITNGLKFSGWFGVSGGVAKYLYKIDDGEWIAFNSGYNDTKLGDNHIGDFLNSSYKDRISDFHKNASYQGKVAIADIQAYANKTVTITLAAVPAGNPGTEEAPNVIIISTVTNVTITCDHTKNTNEFTFNANDPQTLKSDACSVCGKADITVPVTATNAETPLHAFVAGGELTTTPMVDENANGMRFRRFYSAKPELDEERAYIYSSTTPLMDHGRYVAMLWRSSVETKVEIALDNTKDVQRAVNSLGTGIVGQWNFAVLPYADHDSYVFEQGVGNVTLDFFNNGANNRTTDDYTDVAFIAFFASVDEAWDYYTLYLNAYIGVENCPHAVAESTKVYQTGDNAGECKWVCDICKQTVVEPVKFSVNIDFITYPVDKKYVNGKITESTIVIDASDFGLVSSNKINFTGWCVTPMGVSSYKWRVVSEDGVSVDAPVLNSLSDKPGNGSDAVTGMGINRGFTDACRTGASLGGELDLKNYRGKTVNVEIVAVTTYGAEAVIVKLNNVKVPVVFNGYLSTDSVLKIDGVSYKSLTTNVGAHVNANRVTADLSTVTVYDNSTLTMGGWVTADSGIKSYKYVITEGDNKYEITPTGTIQTDPGVTKDGVSNGFDSVCGKNGSFSNLGFNFADVKDANGEAVDLVGKTVTVQMIITANNGTEFVVATFSNITIQAAPAI